MSPSSMVRRRSGLYVPRVTSIYASTILAASPAAYYRLGDSGSTMADSSGNARNGTYNGGVTTGAASSLTGDSDASASWAGVTDSYGVVTYASWQDPTNFTIEARIKPAGAGTTRTIASRYGPTFGVSTWSLRMDSDNVLRLYMFTGGSFNAIAGTFTFTTGTWYSVAATVSGTTVTIYVNGTSVGTGTSSKNASTAALCIGARTSDGSHSVEAWNGGLDEVSFYSTALSGASVAAQHAAA